jgi:hypothetical protein
MTRLKTNQHHSANTTRLKTNLAESSSNRPTPFSLNPKRPKATKSMKPDDCRKIQLKIGQQNRKKNEPETRVLCVKASTQAAEATIKPSSKMSPPPPRDQITLYQCISCNSMPRFQSQIFGKRNLNTIIIFQQKRKMQETVANTEKVTQILVS